MTEKFFKNSGMKYWDDFENRACETVEAIRDGKFPPLRRLSVHITNKCNMRCKYCNEIHDPKTLPLDQFQKVIKEYSDMGGGIVHVTGGEPTVIKDINAYIEYTAKFDNIHFHLNSNLYDLRVTDENMGTIDRLKVSLDTTNGQYFNELVGRKDAYQKVTANLDHVHDLIIQGKSKVLVSLTYTVTKENYTSILEFLEMYYTRWPRFYAVFFSSYKGDNTAFQLQKEHVDELFDKIVPVMNDLTIEYGDSETRFLFKHSNKKIVFKKSNRFPENKMIPCYLQLSELVVDQTGYLWDCSHLYRDKVPSKGLHVNDGHLSELFATKSIDILMSKKCLYGCNKKLTEFNKVVDKRLETTR